MQVRKRVGYSAVDDTKVVFVKKARPKVDLEELRLLETFLPELIDEMMQLIKAAKIEKRTPT